MERASDAIMETETEVTEVKPEATQVVEANGNGTHESAGE